MSLKLLIKNFLKLFGYKFEKIKNSYNLLSEDILRNIFDKKQDLVIFDIGAHIGESSKKYNQLFDNAKIYSFEPSPESYKVLKNLNIKNLKIYNFGFSNKKSIEKFSVNIKSATNSLLSFSKIANKTWEINSLNNLKRIDCKFDTVDNFCSEEKINLIDFMKIDVQGAEYLVLEGAHDTLLNKKIKLIQLEVIIGYTYENQKSIGFYINLLESYGYRFINFSDSVFKTGKLIQSDLFFTI